MTTYKCSQCSGHWTEGPTRNYCETEQCRKCANARICEVEAQNARLREALEDIASCCCVCDGEDKCDRCIARAALDVGGRA